MTGRYYGGIDFSGAREPLANLWSAVGKEVEGRLRIISLRPHAFRQDLAAFVVEGWRSLVPERGSILWGVDYPFGLPAAICAGASMGTRWAEVVDWVADRPPDEVRSAAGDAARSLRAGDVPGALPPLDLRLYKQTVEGLRWLQYLRELGEVSIHPQDPVPESDVTLIEVYPSGTAQELGLPRRRVPGRPGEVRARKAALRTFLDFRDPDCEAAAVNLEDAWDAVIACLTAYLCRDDLEQPFHVGGHDPRVIALEGWTYRPPATVAQNAGRRSR